MARDTSVQLPAVGFIGLGAISSRMARRLLDTGYALTIFNRHAERAQPLAEAGARVVGSPSEVAAASERIVLMLSDDAAVREVASGEQGVLAGARPGRCTSRQYRAGYEHGAAGDVTLAGRCDQEPRESRPGCTGIE